MYPAISMYQVTSFGRGSAYHEALEQLLVDWERGTIFHCKLKSKLETAVANKVTARNAAATRRAKVMSEAKGGAMAPLLGLETPRTLEG